MKSATAHFIAQRVSAIALVLLGLWFAGSMSGLQGFDHAIMFAFAAQPLNATLLALLAVTMAYHSWLGVQVVIDDYVHAVSLHALAMHAARALHVLLAAISLYAIFRLGFSQ